MCWFFPSQELGMVEEQVYEKSRKYLIEIFEKMLN